jgi:hypothetical protein
LINFFEITSLFKGRRGSRRPWQAAFSTKNIRNENYLLHNYNFIDYSPYCIRNIIFVF